MASAGLAHEGDPPPAHMDPKIASLLNHHGIPWWIPLLEANAPDLVKDFDKFKSIGAYSMRVMFDDLNEFFEEHERDEKLPPAKLDSLIAALYAHKSEFAKKSETTAPAAAPAPPPEQPADEPMRDRWAFEQTTTEVQLVLRGLPMSTKAKDVKLKSLARSLSLTVSGEVVLDDARLHQTVMSNETEFDLQDAPGRQSRVLTVTMLKAIGLSNTPPWPDLLEFAPLSGEADQMAWNLVQQGLLPK